MFHATEKLGIPCKNCTYCMTLFLDHAHHAPKCQLRHLKNFHDHKESDKSRPNVGRKHSSTTNVSISTALAVVQGRLAKYALKWLPEGAQQRMKPKLCGKRHQFKRLTVTKVWHSQGPAKCICTLAKGKYRLYLRPTCCHIICSAATSISRCHPKACPRNSIFLISTNSFHV